MPTSEHVSRYYIDVAAKYLAANVALTHIVRKEALNEIRNAFAHVSRADFCEEPAKAQEYQKALDHLQRLALDSAKDSIFDLITKCEHALGVIEVGNMVLPGSVHSTLLELIEKRTKLSEIENASPPTIELVEQYGSLMGEVYEFYKGLDREFNIELVEKRNRSRRKNAIIGLAVSFVLGALASYVANHIPMLVGT